MDWHSGNSHRKMPILIVFFHHSAASIFYCCYFQLLFEIFASLNISLFLNAGRLHKLAWRVNAHGGQLLVFLFVILTDTNRGRSLVILANTSQFLTQADHQNRRFRGLPIHKKNPAWLQKLSCRQPDLSWSSIIWLAVVSHMMMKTFLACHH